MRILFLLIILFTLSACSEGEQSVDLGDPATPADSENLSLPDSIPELAKHALNQSVHTSKFISIDHFEAVWGGDNHKGKEDLSASAVMWSDSTSLHLLVHVSDDSVTFSDDPIHSDHVELWFSTSGRATEVITVTDSSRESERLFLYKDIANIDSFRAELEDPLFVFTTPSEAEEDNFYGRIDTTKRAIEYWTHYGYENELHVLRAGQFSSKHIFNGITHWGIFPDGRSAILYDKELYAELEEQTFTTINVDETSPQYEVVLTEKGYTIYAQLYPENLGFAARNGIRYLDFMVDIVDVDSGEKQETIASSSLHREWGNPSSFTRASLDPPISIKLVDGLEWLGTTTRPDEMDFYYELPERYMYTTEGWIGIATEVGSWLKDLGHHQTSDLPNIKEVAFKKKIVSYFTFSSKGQDFEVIRRPGIDHNDRPEDRLVIDGEKPGSQYFEPTEILSFFTFPDGTPGFFRAIWGYEWGYCNPIGLCGCNIKDQLQAVRVDSTGKLMVKDLVTVDQCGPEIVGADTVRFLSDDDWTRSENITWLDKGSRFAIEFDDAKVVFNWDDAGDNIKYDVIARH